MDSESTSYYAILNVPREATEAEIRRAYKSLAQTFHPDKHSTGALRENATHEFAQINEAYEVLVSPQKRQIYDIYGKQGLTAGLEVGSKLKTVEELRKEWERFKAEREMDSSITDLQHQTHLHCMIDGTSVLDPHTPPAFKKPEIESILLQSTLAKQLTTHHVGWIGGNVVRQGIDGEKGGGGSLLLGCRGMVDSRTGYSTELQWGSQSEARIQTTQQLTEKTQGIVSASYSPLNGMGLSFSSTQTISDILQGTTSLVLGPPEEAGVQLALSQHTKESHLSAKVQVGSMYSLTGKISQLLTPSTSIRAIGRFGFNAIDLDLGVQKQLTPNSNVSLSVVFGIQGTYLKTKWRFGNYALDLPIVLSRDPEEWKVAFIAMTLTPLSITLCRYFIVKPLVAAFRSRRALQERKKHCENIKRVLENALASQQLLRPVAERVMKIEALKSGLVIVKAEFGVFEKQAKALIASSRVPSEEEEFLPPMVIDVTKALQYLVTESQLELFSGVPKSGLMGFCDLVPNQPKSLKIWYLYRNRPCKVKIEDLDGVKLPRQSHLITETKEAEELLSTARESGCFPSTSSST